MCGLPSTNDGELVETIEVERSAPRYREAPYGPKQLREKVSIT
jgi:hypothetical protein